VRWFVSHNWGRLWVSFLAFLQFVAAGSALADVIPKHWFALFVLAVGGLQVATANYQHGEKRGEQKALDAAQPPLQ